MDTVLLPHAHPCTHAVTSLPLKMFAVSLANPTSAVHLGKQRERVADCGPKLFAPPLLLSKGGCRTLWVCLRRGISHM